MNASELNERTADIVDAAMRVHTALGPGLLESVYRSCLAQELRQRGRSVETELRVPILYDRFRLEQAFRIDLLVDAAVVVEVKAVESLMPVHSAQLLSYLKLGGFKVGLLLNFHVLHLKDGIRRMVNGL
jgi:GxxExxY protein